MTKINRLLESLEFLMEAKTYKDRISKANRMKVDGVLKHIYSGTKQSLGIITTDDLIDYIENAFKEYNSGRNYSILSNYVNWLINLFIEGSLDLFNLDLENVAKDILKYVSLKKQKILPSNTNLMDLTATYALTKLLRDYRDPLDDKEYYKQGEARLIYKSEKFSLIKINSFEAAKHFSSGYRSRSCPWCIGESKGHWSWYKNRGYDWYFLLPKTNEKYAIDSNTETVWDSRNEVVLFTKVVKKYPQIEDLLPISVLSLAKQARTDILNLLRRKFNLTEVGFTNFINRDDQKTEFLIEVVSRDEFEFLEASRKEIEEWISGIFLRYGLHMSRLVLAGGYSAPRIIMIFEKGRM